MKTVLIGNKDIPEFDHDIMTNILVTTVELNIVRQEKMLIGIRNAKQEIYRVIGVSSSKQYNNASEELEDLGLNNELEEADRAKNGYDAIFGLTK